MKKILSIFVILAVVVAISACGDQKAEEEARIQDSLEEVRIQDSIMQAEEAALAEEIRIQDSIVQAEAAALAELEKQKATPKTQQPRKVEEDKKQEEPVRRRGGATYGD